MTARESFKLVERRRDDRRHGERRSDGKTELDALEANLAKLQRIIDDLPRAIASDLTRAYAKGVKVGQEQGARIERERHRAGPCAE